MKNMCDDCKLVDICRISEDIRQFEKIGCKINDDSADVEVEMKMSCEHYQEED